LSPYEFEEFVGALFSAHDSRRYARFARGSDEGVDLSYHHHGRLHVIQCKLYVNSTAAQLLTDLKKELPKTRKLRPHSYRLVIGRRLGRKLKDKIYGLFAKFMATADDVYGAQDLDDLLDAHPQVERRTVKLWLASHAVLEAVLHRGTYQRTAALLDEIKEALPRYVQNSAYQQVRKLLKKERVCVIAGDPGVGKTMLAKILIARYMVYGYEPVLVSSNIREAWEMYEPSLKQVFYYDDFLGRTNFIEKLGKNEDQDLWRFIERVAKSRNKALILTTRDYIIAQAESTYARISQLNTQRYRYLFRLPEYTRTERAQILFNHLYRAKLPASVKRAVQRDRAYLRIIDHRNYTPRQVEQIAAAAMRMKPRPSEFVDAAVRALNDPSLIWREAIESELPEAKRALLLLMATFARDVSTDDLETAYDVLHKERFGLPAAEAFEKSLDALEGTFLSIRAVGTSRLVSFGKPSLTDFLVGFLNNHISEVRHLVRSAVFFEQCDLLIGYGQSTTSGAALTFPGIAAAIDPTELLSALTRTLPVRASQRTITMTPRGETVALPSPHEVESRLTAIAQVARQPRYAIIRPWLHAQVLSCSKNWDSGAGALESATDLMWEIQRSEMFPESETRRLVQRLHRSVLRGTKSLEGFPAYLAYQRRWPIESHEWDVVQARLQSIAADLLEGLPSGTELDQLEEYADAFSIDLSYEIEEERGRRLDVTFEDSPEEDESDRPARVHPTTQVEEDSAIDAMFRKLI
jgi:hypothetical protein